MTTSKRSALGLGIAAFLLTLLFLHLRRTASWREMPQVVGLGEMVGDEGKTHDELDNSTDTHAHEGMGVAGINTADPFSSPFVPGTAKPPGSNYTKNLIVAKTKEEHAEWLDNEDLGGVKEMVYVVDDEHASLKVPQNKGHEVMVYLTYIIDHYDELPDVSIFMHSHQFAWHQNDLLGYNAGEMVRRLSPERVTREGYMNLRCHWTPGCPEWMHPGTVEEDPNKQEETVMAQAWAELFPDKSIPEVLAQPCCAQFALSRDRIRAVARERYIFYREWLLRTKMEDKISGRVWEYLWQVVFTGEARFCPNQWSCYCDGYGVCFESQGGFDYWFELRYHLRGHQKELEDWKKKATKVEEYREQGHLVGIEGSEIEIPEAGRDVWLEAEIKKLEAIMEDGKKRAIERGKDPSFRAMSAGRKWSPGDGY
jgi:hypothetical protein